MDRKYHREADLCSENILKPPGNSVWKTPFGSEALVVSNSIAKGTALPESDVPYRLAMACILGNDFPPPYRLNTSSLPKASFR